MENHEPKEKHYKDAQEELLDDQLVTNNGLGFFALLLEIDKRNNPDLYGPAKPINSHA